LITVGVGLLVVASGFAIARMEGTKRELARIAEYSIPVSRSLTRLTSFQLQRVVALERALQSKSATPGKASDDFPQLRAEFARLSELIARDIEHADNIIKLMLQEGSRHVAQAEIAESFRNVRHGLTILHQHHELYQELAKQAFVLCEQGNTDGLRSLQPDIEQEQGLLKERVTALLFELENLVQRSTMETKENLHTAQLMLIVISAFGLVSGTAIGLFLRRRITSSVATAVDAAQRIAAGERKVEFQQTALNETAILLDAMQTMLQSINGTEQRLRESETRVRAVLDTVADGIITIDPYGTIESFNPAAERIFEYSTGEAIGANVRMLMPEPYRGEHDGYLERYRRTGTARIIGIGKEVTGMRKDGTTFPMELAVTEMKLDGQQSFVGMVRDITERKKVDRMKNEFISTVSHELRTPLTSIRGSLGLILGGAAGEVPAKVQGLLSIACNNSERLVRLINDILDIEKIESGKMEFDIKTQELMPLVKHAIEANHSYGQQFGVRYELRSKLDGVYAALDHDRITQVIDNFLSNAAKFSPRDGVVEVAAERRDGNIRVSVTDHGSGIPDEFRSRIFQKFAQADSSDTRQKGGTGLGLSICKAIVETHDGEVGFDSEAGKGTTFYFELPEKQPSSVDTEQTAAALPAGSRILVCEDDHDVAQLLGLMLKQRHFDVDIAYDAQQAKQLLKTQHYAAMTVDLMLPDQNGISLIRELRASDETKHLPIVVVSAKAEQGRSELQGSAFGVIDWLKKPIDQRQLLAAVQQATHMQQGGRLHVLHVEDDPDVTKVVSAILAEDAQITRAGGLHEALQKLKQESFDLIIVDIGLPDGSGLDLLPAINQLANSTPVAIFSAHDVDNDTAHKVDAALVKGRTSNQQLLDTIRSLAAVHGDTP